jgi:hypothetical protein
LREIALRRLVLPHARIHRRRENNLHRRRQQHGGGEIVGETVRHLGHQIGGRRRNHDQVGLARQPDVADVEFMRRVEQVGIDAPAADRACRQRSDELRSRLGENAPHDDAAFLHAPYEIERFVGGDAAADDQQHARLGGWGFAERQAGGSNGSFGVGGGFPQDGPHLVFDRTPVARGAQPELLLNSVIELADGQRGHVPGPVWAGDIRSLIALQSVRSSSVRE